MLGSLPQWLMDGIVAAFGKLAEATITADASNHSVVRGTCVTTAQLASGDLPLKLHQMMGSTPSHPRATIVEDVLVSSGEYGSTRIGTVVHLQSALVAEAWLRIVLNGNGTLAITCEREHRNARR